MASVKRQTPTEWSRQPSARKMDRRVIEAIARRRRQMLVHSCLYYRMDASVIDDATWTRWAQQLAKLQDKFGHCIGFYDAAFEDWDGSSGFHLPADQDVARVAMRLLAEHNERERMLS
jgi:hypothetical protein